MSESRTNTISVYAARFSCLVEPPQRCDSTEVWPRPTNKPQSSAINICDANDYRLKNWSTAVARPPTEMLSYWKAQPLCAANGGSILYISFCFASLQVDCHRWMKLLFPSSCFLHLRSFVSQFILLTVFCRKITTPRIWKCAPSSSETTNKTNNIEKAHRKKLSKQ